MSWHFEIPGQPPSTNHLYRQVTIAGKRRIAKDPKVEHYQILVTYIVRGKRPRGWYPEPGKQLHLYYDFILNRDIDADNALKALNDAIAIALGVNDKLFLPCVRSKSVHKTNEPKVMVEVE